MPPTRAARRYETQAQLLRLLSLLAQHHAAATLCLHLTRDLDAARIVTVACVAAAADAILRMRAVDTPSALSEHYAGRMAGPLSPFGVDHHPFAHESETLKFTEPALLVARGMALDYFASVRRVIVPANRIFGWGNHTAFGDGELRLVAQLCTQLGFSCDDSRAHGSGAAVDTAAVSGSLLPRYLTGESPELLLLYPELAAFRDLIFLFKLFMVPEHAMLPPRNRWKPSDATLRWSHRHEDHKGRAIVPPVLLVAGFGRESLIVGPVPDESSSSWIRDFATRIGLVTSTGGNIAPHQPRAPLSGANPSALVSGHGLETTPCSEDDVLAVESEVLLSMQQLVADGVDPGDLSKGTGDRRPPLSARDAELLLTYLTAPYLRVPLLVNFFADQQRLNALSSTRLQEVLEAALFEPGTWQEDDARPPPTHIPPRPEERARVLATPLGLLFNELAHSPMLLLEPLERLLDMALDLDTGAYYGPSANILCFVVRLIVRVESYALLLLRHGKWRHKTSAPSSPPQHTAVRGDPSVQPVPASEAFRDVAMLHPPTAPPPSPPPSPSPAQVEENREGHNGSEASKTGSVVLPSALEHLSAPPNDPPPTPPSVPAQESISHVAEAAVRDEDDTRSHGKAESMVMRDTLTPANAGRTAAVAGRSTDERQPDAIAADAPAQHSPVEELAMAATRQGVNDDDAGVRRNLSPPVSGRLHASPAGGIPAAATPASAASQAVGGVSSAPPALTPTLDMLMGSPGLSGTPDTTASHRNRHTRSGGSDPMRSPTPTYSAAEPNSRNDVHTARQPVQLNVAVHVPNVKLAITVEPVRPPTPTICLRVHVGATAAGASKPRAIATVDETKPSSSDVKAGNVHGKAAAAAASVPQSAADPGMPGPDYLRSTSGWRVLARGLECLQQIPEDYEATASRIAKIRKRLDEQVFPLLDKWFERAGRDKDIRAACIISAHLAFMLKNLTAEQLDFRAMTTLLASQIFLTHNFGWDAEKAVEGPRGMHHSPTPRDGVRQSQQQMPQVGSQQLRSDRKRSSFEAAELGIPQTQIFDLFQHHRRAILARLRAHPEECTAAMEAVSRVVTFTGTRLGASTARSEQRQWSEMDTDRNAGRFILEVQRGKSSSRNAATDPASSGTAEVNEHAVPASDSSISDGDAFPAATAQGQAAAPSVAAAMGSFDAWLTGEELARSAQEEVNVQLGEYHASTHKQMRVLPPELVQGFPDFNVVFGSGADALSFQSAEVQTTAQRTWLRLVGQRHDLQRWAAFDHWTEDASIASNAFSKAAASYLGGMIPHLVGSLPWVNAVLEPVRAAHFPHLQLVPAERIALFQDKSAANVVLLESQSQEGICNEKKEIMVKRSPPVVYVFNVVEHGRRWYRTLVFASDASYSLATLDARVAHHGATPALACGDALTRSPPAPSLVISRSFGGMVGGMCGNGESDEQTFLPTRLLRGLLPTALLELYTFWQNGEDHSIEGYPSTLHLAEPAIQPTVLHVTLNVAPCLLGDSSTDGGVPQTAATVRRYRVQPVSSSHDDGAPKFNKASILSGMDWRSLHQIDLPSTMSRDGIPTEAEANAEQMDAADEVAYGNGLNRARTRNLPLGHQWRRLSGGDDILLNLSHADEGTPLARIAAIFRRLDDLSHVLAWARIEVGRHTATPPASSETENGKRLSWGSLMASEPRLFLIELPRLRLSFEVRTSMDEYAAGCNESPSPTSHRAESKGYAHGDRSAASGVDGFRLYCREHASYFISNTRPQPLARLLEGLPHAVLLEGDDGQLAVLVSAAAKPIIVPRADGKVQNSCLFMRADGAWLAAMPQARHYFYPIHPSHALLSSPSLAASLYLLLLYFIHGRYAEVMSLVETCNTDHELSQEEAQIWRSLSLLTEDGNVDAHAARLKIYLMTVDSPSLDPPWELKPSLEVYVLHRCALSASCRLSATEELLLLREVVDDDELPAAHAEHIGDQLASSSTGPTPPPSPTRSDQPARAARVVSPEWERELRLREYLATLLAITESERSEAHNGARQPAGAELIGSGAQDKQTTSNGELSPAARMFPHVSIRPRQYALERATWFDLAVEPRQFLALLPDDPLIHNASLEYYQKIQNNVEEEALDELVRVWQTLSVRTHFMLIYELLLGSVRLHICRFDSGANLGALLVRSLPPSDWKEGAAGAPLVQLLFTLVGQRERLAELHPKSALHAAVEAETSSLSLRDRSGSKRESVVQNMAPPTGLAQQLPRYDDIRKAKEIEDASGQKLKRALQSLVIGDEIARLLVVGAHEALTTARAALVIPPAIDVSTEWYLGHSHGSVMHPLASVTRKLLAPRVVNHDCARRLLSASKGSSGIGHFVRSADELAIGVDFLNSMSAQPLEPLGLHKYVEVANASEHSVYGSHEPNAFASEQQAPPARELKQIFDLTLHPQARDHTALEMLRRLDDDVRHYAQQYSSDSLHLTGLLPHDVAECITEAKEGKGGVFLLRSSRFDHALTQIAGLIERLRVLQSDDSRAMAAGLTAVGTLANCEHLDGASRADIVHALRRLAHDEMTLSFPMLAVQLLSTDAEADLILYNPQLGTDGRLEELLRVIGAILFRTTRLAYVAQCSSQARMLQTHMQALRERAKDLQPSALGQERRELSTRSAALASALSVRRYTLHWQSMASSSGDGAAREVYCYDPRFAVFEFAANIFLREGQVRLVEDCVATVRAGKSLVTQMIMGAGKTSTILPLLALLLADSSQLVVQVVPAPLLVFTINVLRSRFSSVVSKAIFTFHFERATAVARPLLEKLQKAKDRRAVVTTTPTALKSFALRFLELAHTLDYMSRAEPGKEHNIGSLLRNFGAKLFATSSTVTKPDEKVQELRDQVRLCREVLELFGRGILVLDEVDTILHPLRSELNWPLGGKVSLDFTTDKEAPGLRWLLPFHALDPFFFATGGQCVMELNDSDVRTMRAARKLLQRIEDAVRRGCNEQALQRVPHLVLLDRRFYRRVLRPLLAEWLLLLLFQLGLRALDYDEALLYLDGNAQRVPAQKLSELHVDGKQLKLLNLSFELLETIVPFVLAKVDRVAFGLLSTAQLRRNRIQLGGALPRKRRMLAVPFIGKDTPSRASEFSHPDVVISLTILAYRYEGLRETDFLTVMNSLKQSMAAQFGPYHKREACRRYVAWVEGANAQVRGMRRRGGRARSDRRHSQAPTIIAPKDVLERNTLSGRAKSSDSSDDKSQVEVWPLHLVDLGDEEQMGVLFALLRRQPQVVRHYLFHRVFPRTMEFQQMKLSVCGQELGGDLLFGRRLGFSGTPSDLLPVELVPCRYARGDDAQMLHVLTSPNVVRYATPLTADWSALSLLHSVANWTPPLHALIDTGALVTGMSNVEVARSLLELGLQHVRGCVFIDDDGQRRILMRDGLRIMRLEQCGLALSQRFSFYDQVHTSGMDILQPPAAHAALTLSKDMTFRDYAQGAYRMRGIGEGQRIELLVIPEVQRLIDDAVGAAAGVGHRAMAMWRRESSVQFATGSEPEPRRSSIGTALELVGLGGLHQRTPSSLGQPHARTQHGTLASHLVAAARSGQSPEPSAARESARLRNVVMWLHLNSMRLEKAQFHLLVEQTLSNVWRKAAYRWLLENHELLGVRHGDAAKPPSRKEERQHKRLQHCIDIFRNKIALEVTEYSLGRRDASYRRRLLDGGIDLLLREEEVLRLLITEQSQRDVISDVLRKATEERNTRVAAHRQEHGVGVSAQKLRAGVDVTGDVAELEEDSEAEGRVREYSAEQEQEQEQVLIPPPPRTVLL